MRWAMDWGTWDGLWTLKFMVKQNFPSRSSCINSLHKVNLSHVCPPLLERMNDLNLKPPQSVASGHI